MKGSYSNYLRQFELFPFTVPETLNCQPDDLLFSNIVCVEVLRPSQPNGVMSSVVTLPNHTFTGQA